MLQPRTDFKSVTWQQFACCKDDLEEDEEKHQNPKNMNQFGACPITLLLHLLHGNVLPFESHTPRPRLGQKDIRPRERC